MRYERPIFIAGILPSCNSLYPVLVLIRRASHICSMLEKNLQFFPKKSTAPSPAFCTCASYTKPQPVSFAKGRKRAEGVDKTGELEYGELEYKEITTKTFLEHSGIHGTENGFG